MTFLSHRSPNRLGRVEGESASVEGRISFVGLTKNRLSEEESEEEDGVEEKSSGGGGGIEWVAVEVGTSSISPRAMDRCHC